MDRFDKLLKRLNCNPQKQQKLDWAENIPDDIWYEFFDAEGYDVLETNVNVDRRRWYEVSTTVVKIFGRCLSIRQVSQIYTETMDAGDVGHSPTYKEVFPVVVGGVEYL